jgi:glycosyltransferase involved in cell wall biosynthesis
VSGPIRVLELRSVRGTGGGPDKTILYGARDTDPARFAVTVCYMRDRRDPEYTIDQRARELGLDYVEILERHSFDPAIWPALRTIVRDRKIQIVHAHDYKTNLLAWLVARREPVIPLSTVHGWFGREMWRERLYYSVDKRVLSRFPRVIAVSETLKQELVAAGCPADRIAVVQNGIDHRVFVREPGRREEIRRGLGIAADDVVIGAVGRLEHQKRFDLLMEVVARLRQRHSKLRLFIVGAGGLDDELKAVHQRLGLGEACVFLGHRPDVPLLHNAFDLFVQSSDREGSPNVVLEAMALGTPIVATDVGGTRDLVVDDVHGLIVPPTDGQALEGAIERVLADWPAAAARAAAARRRVEEELTFDLRMDRVEAIYEELVASLRPKEVQQPGAGR